MDAVDFHLYLFMFVFANTGAYKRYDIEQQCKQEYGLTLDGVLRQFRRSEEYRKILEAKKIELKEKFLDVSIKIQEFHITKMLEKIKAEMGISEANLTTASTYSDTTTTKKTAVRSRGKHISDLRREGGDAAAEEQDPRIAKVQRVDNYSKLHPLLTLKERNKYKGYGFTCVGDTIHDVIKAFGGVPGKEPAEGSTRGLEDEQSTLSTTEHMIEHTKTETILSTRLTQIQDDLPKFKYAKKPLLVVNGVLMWPTTSAPVTADKHASSSRESTAGATDKS